MSRHERSAPGSVDGGAAENPYRSMPSVNELVDATMQLDRVAGVPRPLVVEAARRSLEGHRAAIGEQGEPPLSLEQLAQRVRDTVVSVPPASSSAVINATGVLLHTGLGRAPLATSAADALRHAAEQYVPVELDVATGERGQRALLVRQRLVALTGAESATVVNNNAAALLITLSTIARGRCVVVSRGELIEIGGSFRLPEVMAVSGAQLREVGTTNKTRLSDYQQAIDDTAAALLKVHPSNYRVAGFTEEVALGSLVELGRAHDLPVVHDAGSGAVLDFGRFGLEHEPMVQASIDAGVDLVLFSGDKLLGGPQAGVIVGRREWVQRIEKNPLMRSLRVDKLTLTALAATLDLHLQPRRALDELPVLRMVNATVDSLGQRARQVVDAVTAAGGPVRAEVIQTTAYLGGGSLPEQGLPSVAVRLTPSAFSEQELARRLRGGAAAVIPRIHAGAVLLDMRTVFPNQDASLAEATCAAVRA